MDLRRKGVYIFYTRPESEARIFSAGSEKFPAKAREYWAGHSHFK